MFIVICSPALSQLAWVITVPSAAVWAGGIIKVVWLAAGVSKTTIDVEAAALVQLLKASPPALWPAVMVMVMSCGLVMAWALDALKYAILPLAFRLLVMA